MSASADTPTPTQMKPAVSSPYWRTAHRVRDPERDAIHAELLRLYTPYQRTKGEREVPAAHPSSAITKRTDSLSYVDEPSFGTTHLSPVIPSAASVATPYKARHSSFYKALSNRSSHTNLPSNESNGVRPQSEYFNSGTLQFHSIHLNVPTELSVCEKTLNNLCYFHQGFVNTARNCRRPCSWNLQRMREHQNSKCGTP